MRFRFQKFSYCPNFHTTTLGKALKNGCFASLKLEDERNGKELNQPFHHLFRLHVDQEQRHTFSEGLFNPHQHVIILKFEVKRLFEN